MESKIGDYSEIMSDRNLFNKVVYTPLSEALKLLEERRNNPELMRRVEDLLNGEIPDVLVGNKCGVMARQVATPNFDTQFFLKLTRENGLKSVLFEYPEDKFTSKNIFKHSLGKIIINLGINKIGNDIVEKINIIVHVKCDGKKIREIKTLWGESLVDFHRKLFSAYEISGDYMFYDISDWYKIKGGNASNYYMNFLLLFVCHGILFENFLTIKSSEGDFTKNILLPSIEKIIDKIGVKPLIVPMDPIDIENEDYWISHPLKIKNHILNY
jgi:hypothetical protein